MATANPLPLSGARLRLAPHVLERVLAAPVLRADAVARGRSVVESDGWHRDREVAAELVDCLLGQRLP